MNLQQARNFAKSTEYKNEIRPTSVTVWFHEGNGSNFKIKQTANKLYITKYRTNGHQNVDLRTVVIKGGGMPATYVGAVVLWDEWN